MLQIYSPTKGKLSPNKYDFIGQNKKATNYNESRGSFKSPGTHKIMN